MALSLCLLSSLFLFSACGTTSTNYQQAVPTNTGADMNISPNADDTLSVLQDLVNAINDHDISACLSLFDDSATVTIDNLSNSGANQIQVAGTLSYMGKSNIESWLQARVTSTLQVVLTGFRVTTNSVTLETRFNYSTLYENVEIDAKTQGGKITFLDFLSVSISSSVLRETLA